MRQKLETEIVNTLIPYRDNLPLDEIQTQITIILNNFRSEWAQEHHGQDVYNRLHDGSRTLEV